MNLILLLLYFSLVLVVLSVKPFDNILKSINNNGYLNKIRIDKIKIDNIIPLDITNNEKIIPIDINININKISKKIQIPIDNISKRSIEEFKSKNIIPNNYEVLKVNKNNINENKNMNIDVKSESIPFGLEIIGGLASSLLLDSLLPLEIIFTAESIFLAYIMFLRNIWY